MKRGKKTHKQDKTLITPAAHLDAERMAFLALGAIKGVGFETLRRLALAKVSFSEILDLEDGSEVRRLLGQSKLNLEEQGGEAWRETKKRALDHAFRRTEELDLAGISILFPHDPSFPRQLLDLRDAPCWLFVQGNIDVLSRPSLAVVGSRKASDDGIWLTRYVGHWLKEFDAPTVSGLADGIDQQIHLASIKAGVPTIAFLGTGIFNDYPKGSDAVRHAIIRSQGAVATEYLIKESYSAANFVRRNRLQAALGNLLIPTEWAVKSGTAHTVRYAYTLGRPIAFLRTPSQPNLEWVPKEYARNGGLFTIPFDQDRFVEFVKSNLASKSVNPLSQLKLL